MITSRHHHLYIQHHDWNVAHLYEHLLIAGAKKYLEKHGFSKDFFGWISGETFEDYIFLDAFFYQKEAAECFDNYLETKPTFTDSDIAWATKCIEAEEKVTLHYDAANVKHALNELNSHPWNTQQSSTGNRAVNKIITPRPSAKDFRDISIVFGANDLTNVEQKVFLRLRPILVDITYSYLGSMMPLYERGTSPVARRGSMEKFLTVYTIPRINGRLISLQQQIEDHFHTYPINKHTKELTAHFSGFASEQLWKDSATEYYRYTGIVTTTDEIASLATSETIAAILRKLYIRIRSATAHDKAAIHN